MFKIEELGWDAFFEAQWDRAKESEYHAARVAEEQKGFFRVWAECGELLAEASGKLRHEARSREELPAAGDWVLVKARPREGRATIHRVLGRKSKFSRKTAGATTEEQILAANVDTLFLVMALDRDFTPRRIERYLTLAWESGARPVVVLSKADLANDAEATVREVEGASMGVPVVAVSAVTGEGFSDLQRFLAARQTAALVGSSGVGKSTIINQWMGSKVQAVAEIGAGTGRGRHTTTARQLVRLPGGALLLDTPGMRELQLWDGASVANAFADIESHARACHFRDCRHHGEPGCAVAQAILAGELAEERLESYRKLEREARFLETKQDVRARLEQKRYSKHMCAEQKRFYKK